MMYDWNKILGMKSEILQDPVVREYINSMTQELEHYWKMNVNKYFSKSQQYINTLALSNHRLIVVLAKGHTGGLQNAILINWDPKFGKVHIDVGEARNPLNNKDYIPYLMKGTPTSKGRYVLARNIRFNEGERKGTSNAMWKAWAEDFVIEVDTKIRICADKIAARAGQMVARKISEEFG